MTIANYFNESLSAELEDLSVNPAKRTLPVTVVAANFNNSKYLFSFFWSILNGTSLPEKIIIVDDKSTDNSAEILAQILKRVNILEVIFLDKNIGFANALNIAIEKTCSPILMRIDPDDICGENRLASQYFEIVNNSYDFIGSNAIIFDDSSGRFVTETNFPIFKSTIEDRIKSGEHGMLHPTVMGKSALFKTLKYRQEHVPAEDYDIFARALVIDCNIGNISAPHLYYRAHSSSASTNLKYSLIRKTYDLREVIFGLKTSIFIRVRYFIFISSYRKYLFNKNKFYKLFYGMVAALISPKRLISRIFR